MRNRTIAVLSLVVILAMLLGACGQPAATPEPTAAPVEQPAEAEPTAAPTEAPAATEAPEATAAPAEAGGGKGLSADQPLSMLFVPSGQADQILAGGQQLDELLAEKGIYTESSVATSYAAAIEAVCAGQVDLAWLATLSYVLAHDKCDAPILLSSVRFGSPTYNGQIIVRTDSGIETVADLAGKRFAYTDPASTSGYLYPAALMLEEGVDPETDLAEAVFAGSHNAAAIAVYQGSADAAATYVDVRSQLQEQFPDIMEVTKVIALTDDIPNDTITASPELDPAVAEQFKQAMLEVMDTEEGKEAAYTIYEWDGVVEGDDALFEPVRQAAAGLGIELQNWKGVSTKYLVGQVTDVGGIDDRSFNATAWAGVEQAMAELEAEGQYLESQQQTDYEVNINEFLRQDYDLIITVGFLLGDATQAAAEANPDANFAIVDYAYDPPIDNVLGLTFSTDQAAFLAGYAAAGMTETGVVGTFGGLKIPTVTIFMVGFERGVQHYNEVHGTDVRVLGWTSDASQEGGGDGLFTGNFESTDDGRRFAEQLMDEGADIIMPVAGPVGLGAAAAVQERGAKLIGVDTDWYVSAPEYQEIYLTSVMKNMDVAVFDSIKALTRGSFQGGTYVGTLENAGVAIAPFHDYEDAVSQELKDEIAQLQEDLIAGTLSAGWPVE